MSLVSVIIPNYNCAKWLPLTLDSCLAQKEQLKEIIVVDDFSTDESWQIIEQYQQQFPHLLKPVHNLQKGGNNARNHGFSFSTGDYIQWLDADDQILPGKFSNQLAMFSKDDFIDIVYSDWQLNIYNEKGDLVSKEYKEHKQYDDFLFELLTDNWSSPHNYLIRRRFADKLMKANAWNPSTQTFQDREYFTLAAIWGANFQYVKGNFSVYNRWNKNSVSQNHEKKKSILFQLFSRFQEQIEASKEISAQKKAYYKRAIISLELLAQISSDKLKTKNKELKYKNICWPVLKSKRAKMKMIIALILNPFLSRRRITE